MMIIKIKPIPSIVFLGFFVFGLLAFASSPTLRNEMFSHLKRFKETVERQAREFPEFFFLSSPNIEEKKVALTFDDGPDGKYTPAILDLLQEKKVKATFFLLGENVQNFPEVTRRIHEEGHLIGNHSWSHPDFREMKTEEILAREIYPTGEIIAQITGETPVFVRPPYGAITDSSIKQLGELGFKIVNWSVDSFDWDQNLNQPEEILDRVLKYIQPGDIILFHSAGGSRENTVKALEKVINSVEKKGFWLTTVDEIINWSDQTIN